MWIWEVGPPSPFPSLWSPLTHPPRPVQTSYLSPLPLSHTAASPSLWSGFTSRGPPRFPPERLHVHRSRWAPHVLCLGTPRPPRSDGNALVGGSLKSRPRINQFDDVGAEWLTEWSQPCTCVLPLRSPFKSSDWRGGTESWPLLSGDSYSRCPAISIETIGRGWVQSIGGYETRACCD